jgi:thiamine-monophosphate kinase
MGRASRQTKIQIAGGDTTRAPKIFISVTVVGEIGAGWAIKRSGARPGDLIFVTGRLGRAALGLELIQRGCGSHKSIRTLLAAHFYPRIQLELGAWLARYSVASSMMDVSDGLSTDLSRLCAASRVGARVNARQIPVAKVSASQSRLLQKLSIDLPQLALHGGDDYGLLFTVPRRRVARLRRAPGFSEITQIGEIVSGNGILLVEADGRVQRLKPRGWDSFRKPSSKKSR